MSVQYFRIGLEVQELLPRACRPFNGILNPRELRSGVMSGMQGMFRF